MKRFLSLKRAAQGGALFLLLILASLHGLAGPAGPGLLAVPAAYADDDSCDNNPPPPFGDCPGVPTPTPTATPIGH